MAEEDDSNRAVSDQPLAAEVKAPQETRVKSDNDRTVAILVHLSLFLAYFVPFANLLLPFIVFMIYKNERESLAKKNSILVFNFQICLMAIYLGLFLVILMGAFSLGYPGSLDDTGIGFVLLGITFVAAILIIIFTWFAAMYYSIRNAIRVSDGNVASYPYSIHLIK